MFDSGDKNNTLDVDGMGRVFLNQFACAGPEAFREIGILYRFLGRLPLSRRRLAESAAWACHCLREYGENLITADDIELTLICALQQRRRRWRSEVCRARNRRLGDQAKAAVGDAVAQRLIEKVALKNDNGRSCLSDIEVSEHGWKAFRRLRRNQIQLERKQRDTRCQKAEKAPAPTVQEPQGEMSSSGHALSIKGFVLQKGFQDQEAARISKSFQKWMRRRRIMPEPAVAGHPAGGGRKAEAHKYAVPAMEKGWSQYRQVSSGDFGAPDPT